MTFSSVHVRVLVLCALIENFPGLLPIFAESVLGVLELLLSIKDVRMVRSSTMLLETFCKRQKMVLISDEDQVAATYQAL